MKDAAASACDLAISFGSPVVALVEGVISTSSWSEPLGFEAVCSREGMSGNVDVSGSPRISFVFAQASCQSKEKLENAYLETDAANLLLRVCAHNLAKARLYRPSRRNMQGIAG